MVIVGSMTNHDELAGVSEAQQAAIAVVEAHAAHNYHPLPVVVSQASGATVTDIDGKVYLDCLAAYSAVNFGHANPQLTQVAKDQIDKVTLTSRAFHSAALGPFAEALSRLRAGKVRRESGIESGVGCRGKMLRRAAAGKPHS